MVHDCVYNTICMWKLLLTASHAFHKSLNPPKVTHSMLGKRKGISFIEVSQFNAVIEYLSFSVAVCE